MMALPPSSAAIVLREMTVPSGIGIPEGDELTGDEAVAGDVDVGVIGDGAAEGGEGGMVATG